MANAKGQITISTVKDGENGLDSAQPNLFGYDCNIENANNALSFMHTKDGLCAYVIGKGTGNDNHSAILVNVPSSVVGREYYITGKITFPNIAGKFYVVFGKTYTEITLGADKTFKVKTEKGVDFDNGNIRIQFSPNSQSLAYSGLFVIEKFKVEDATGLTDATPFAGLANDNIPLGQNLLLNTSDFGEGWRTQDNHDKAFDGTLQGNKVLYYQGGKYNAGSYYNFALYFPDLVAGKTYTWSWWQRGNTTLYVAVQNIYPTSGQTNLVVRDCDVPIVVTNQTAIVSHAMTGDWEFHSITFKPTSVNGAEKPYIRFCADGQDNVSGKNFYVAMPKLEEGEKPTAWQKNEADRQGNDGQNGVYREELFKAAFLPPTKPSISNESQIASSGWSKQVPNIIRIDNITGDGVAATESGNKRRLDGKDDNSIVCDIVEFTTEQDNVTLNILLEASSEENYDLLWCGKLDTQYNFNSSLYGIIEESGTALSGSETYRKSINIAKSGQHFVYIIYVKDGSDYDNDDCGYYTLENASFIYTTNNIATYSNTNKRWEYNPNDWSTPLQYKPKGVMGMNGYNGVQIRPRGQWSANETYVYNTMYQDVVIYDNNTYVVKTRNTTATKGVSPDKNATHWLKADEYRFVATSLLLAELAFIKNLGVNNLIVSDTQNTIKGGMTATDKDEKGNSLGLGDVRFWLGGSNPQQAPARIYENGDVYFGSGTFEGTLKAKTMFLDYAECKDIRTGEGSWSVQDFDTYINTQNIYVKRLAIDSPSYITTYYRYYNLGKKNDSSVRCWIVLPTPSLCLGKVIEIYAPNSKKYSSTYYHHQVGVTSATNVSGTLVDDAASLSTQNGAFYAMWGRSYAGCILSSLQYEADDEYSMCKIKVVAAKIGSYYRWVILEAVNAVLTSYNHSAQ